MDVLDLARLQFALTGNIHFLFVVLTLGLAPLVAIMQTRYTVSGMPVHERMTRFWGNIYLINYALGIVTGLVMEFQFGLNWGGLVDYAGDVFGAPLAIETMLAFFLESTFLGLWILGWHRMNRWLHLACIWMVVLTAYASAFWIMVANSFLQNPAGAVERGGRLVITDFGALLGNPALVMALPHVLGAGLFTGGFVIMGASAYHLFRRTAEQEFFRTSLRTGVTTAFLGVLLTIGSGYGQFAFVSRYQTDRFESVEAIMGTMITIGEVLQLLMLFVLFPLQFGHRLARRRWLHPLLMIITPLPYVAVVFGWLTRELARQPWVVYGRLTTADALSPGLTEGAVAASLIAFGTVLGLLAIADLLLIIRAIRRGPGHVTLGAPPVPAPPAEPAPALSH
jgi:Cytochrome bd-type quinol oxidase, subunit 1